MNLITRYKFALSFIFLGLTVTACAVLPGTLEVSLQPEAQAFSQVTVLDELRPVLESILFGGIEERRALVSYTTTACTTADGLGGPPKCDSNQSEGTLVQVLPILSGEGTFATPEGIHQALDFVVMDLFAIYRVPEDDFQADNQPASEYGLVFSRELNTVPLPLTVFVEDGRIVRLHHHFNKQPGELIDQLPVEAIILTPDEAREWTSENRPEEPEEHSPGEESTGAVTGKLCYPSEFIPEMTLYFQELANQEITEMATSEDQGSYLINLSPGQYIAYAYLNSGASLGGSYSNAVLCGLDASCTDHSPVQFDVKTGQTLSAVDICDWYAPDAIPPDPRAALAPLVDMVYRTREGDHFWVEANGNSDFIYNGSNLAIPFSGPYGVYFDSNDLYALHMFNGESYQLTDTPDLVETSYHFDVGLPEQIVFTAIPVGEQIGPGYTGGLYIINLDATNQRTLDNEHNAGNFDTAPDGQAIAYGAGETAFLYRWETGVEIFNPRDYGMNTPKGQVVTSPSWSPSAGKLAWFVSGFFDGQETQGFGIFDMFENTFRLIHPFQSLGIDITPPPAVWSQDGEWIAISVFDQDPARSGVWLVNVLNPGQEFFIGTATSNPVFGPWRADKKILTYFKFDQSQGESRTWIYDLVSGEHQLAPLPPEAQVIAWR